MSDINPKEIYKAYREDQKVGPLARPLFLARILAIAVACLGAIPTGYNLYQSWAHGIPYSQVSHRLEQYQIWTKNIDCKIDYRQVGTGKGTKVDVGACPSSGDIALKLTTAAGKSSYEWIEFNQLEKATSQASLWNALISSAHAEDAPVDDAQSKALPTTRLQFAQAGGAGMQVKCEAIVKGKIIRVVNDAGKCFREHIAPMQGRLEKREEVPCTTTCTAAG
jgi:hypothetical protein